MGRIVIVEDSDVLRADLVEEVELWGHDVASVENGSAGLEAVKAFKPDLILSDVNVPGMNGIDLLNTVRAMDAPLCCDRQDKRPSPCIQRWCRGRVGRRYQRAW